MIDALTRFSLPRALATVEPVVLILFGAWLAFWFLRRHHG